MVKGVIFDMDGVLIDSQPLHFNADILTLEAFGVKITRQELEGYAGTTNMTRFGKFKELYGIPLPLEEIIKAREKTARELFMSEPVSAVDGVRDFISDLKSNGLILSVASSTGIELVRLILERIGLIGYFDFILSGSELKCGKPAPDIFLLAAEKMGLNPTECLVVEDSQNGVAAGTAAGMPVIGYINPTSGKQDLSKATVVTDSFKKINAKTVMRLF